MYIITNFLYIMQVDVSFRLGIIGFALKHTDKLTIIIQF